MNEQAILRLAQVVEERLDDDRARRFSRIRDERVGTIANPLVAALRRTPGSVHPMLVYDAVWRQAKRHAPGAFGYEDDGTETIVDDSWSAALRAAFYAAVGYAMSSDISAEDRATLVGSWERVMGGLDIGDE